MNRAESREAEHAELVREFCPAVQSQVRQDLAHDAGELEPVSGESRRDKDVAGFRMRVENKVLVV